MREKLTFIRVVPFIQDDHNGIFNDDMITQPGEKIQNQTDNILNSGKITQKTWDYQSNVTWITV